jgi:hypothetical protein
MYCPSGELTLTLMKIYGLEYDENKTFEENCRNVIFDKKINC